jgi:integrase
MLDLDDLALIEANQLTDKQYDDFLNEVEKIPSVRSPIDGKSVRLAFEFMEDVGTRITETLHIRKNDLDFGTGIVIITHPKTEKQCKCSIWRYKDIYTRKRILEKSDASCKVCHGKGKWKKPQRTTFTPRLVNKLHTYCEALDDNGLLWPTTRQSFWTWGKKAGRIANINIFQQKDERKIEGIFLHLFRALCSKRTTRDAKEDPYSDQLVQAKLRHSITVTDRYTKVDINYLINWERKKYGIQSL